MWLSQTLLSRRQSVVGLPPRLMVTDSVLYGFVRELLAQSSSDQTPQGMLHADFYISRVLFEHDLLPGPGKHLSQYAVQEDGWTLQELYSHHLLTPADTAFMRQQIEYSTGFGLNQRFLPNHQIIPADTALALIKKLGGPVEALKALGARYRTNSFTCLSSPLFSRDGKTVIVEISEVCDGVYCGNGQTWLLQCRQGRWHKVRLLSEWMS